jgi:predicted AlkP superfamily phosphohydrolase/phosphomutase
MSTNRNGSFVCRSIKGGDMSRTKAVIAGAIVLCMAYFSFNVFGQQPTSRPRVVVVGVNGMEWDIIRPLLLRGELPSLASVIQRGVYGKLRTLSAPNCPKIYTALATSVPPEDNGITGFVVAGTTANTKMLKQEPLWSILSRNNVSVGMANVPATFPVMPVNGYMVSGMLTRGKGCEDGLLCSPKLSEVEGGDAVYPSSLIPELQEKVGDFQIDCSRMPTREQLNGREAQAIDEWLDQVSHIRSQQTKLFEFLLSNHPTDFTMLVQSCEDRVGHWLYPIQPHNLGYDPKLHALRLQAFPDQYRAFDRVLGQILKHVDAETYLFIISDHGIKPLREFEESRMVNPGTHQHDANTPIIAHHDFADGDDVPGLFIAAGPNIRKDQRLMGFPISVFDIAPTILHLFGIQQPVQMRGRVMTEIFEEAPGTSSSANASSPRP